MRAVRTNYELGHQSRFVATNVPQNIASSSRPLPRPREALSHFLGVGQRASLYTTYISAGDWIELKEIFSDTFRVEHMDVRTIKEQVVDLLRDAILSGKISTGERLNESVLARELGLSRIPVREALQKLQGQGLVVDAPRRGKFVVNLSDEEIQKINGLRLILEGEALRLCRAKISPEG